MITENDWAVLEESKIIQKGKTLYFVDYYVLGIPLRKVYKELSIDGIDGSDGGDYKLVSSRNPAVYISYLIGKPCLKRKG